MVDDRKKILLIVPHMPAFDSCMPLMIRLHQRGKVDVKIIINHRIIKIDARLEHALKAWGVPYEVKSLPRIELFSWLQIARSNFILTHSDPVAYGGKFRPRDNFMKVLKKYCFYSTWHGAAGSINKRRITRRFGLLFTNSSDIGKFSSDMGKFTK